MAVIFTDLRPDRTCMNPHPPTRLSGSDFWAAPFHSQAHARAHPISSHPYSHSCLDPAFPRRTSTLAAECSLSVILLQYAEQYPPGTPGWIPFIRGSQSQPALPGARPARGNLSVPRYNPIPGSIMSKYVGFALDGYIQEKQILIRMRSSHHLARPAPAYRSFWSRSQSHESKREREK